MKRGRSEDDYWSMLPAHLNLAKQLGASLALLSSPGLTLEPPKHRLGALTLGSSLSNIDYQDLVAAG